jgi:O-antigen ligase
MKTLLQNRFEIVLSSLIIALPFSKALPNIILLFLVFMLIIGFNKIELKKFNISLKILNLLLIFLILKSILFGCIIEDYSYYRFYFIIIMISILFQKVKNFLLLKKAILISVNLSLLFSIYKITLYYFNYNYLPFNDGWAVNRILMLERPYAGFFSLISIIISLDLLKCSKKYKGVYILSILMSTVFLFIISARISILSLIIIGFLYFLFFIRKGIIFKVLMILFTTIVLFSVFNLNRNLAKRFFLNENLQTSYLIAKDSEPRIIIWSCALKMITSEDFNNIIGNNSYSETYTKLTKLYSKNIENIQKRNWFINQQYNTHNQFIDIYLIGGFFSFSIFILFIVRAFHQTINNFIGLSIMISLTLFLLVENLFQRQFGVYIFIITYCVYFSINDSLRENYIMKNEKN